MTPPLAFPQGGTRRTLLGKFGWTSLASVVQMLAGLASVVLLTRFLSPADYGLYGIAIIAIAAGEVLTGGVLSSQIEQKPDITRADLNTAFWANSGLALVCSIATLTGGGLIAQAAGFGDAVRVIAAACLLMLLTAAGVVPVSLLRRRQAFRALAVAGMVAALIGLASGIALALNGWGVWSLVGLESVRRLILLIAHFGLAGWRPDGGLDVRAMRAGLPFVSGMLAANALGRVDRLAPQVAATMMFGPEGLGVLTVAVRIADQIQAFVAQPIGAMALPVLAEAAPEPARFHALMTDAWRAIALTSFPMLAGFAALAPLIVPAAIGEDFAGAGLIAAITVLAHQRVIASKVNIAAVQAAGRALTASASLGISFAVHVILLIVLAPMGLLAIAAAALLRGWITWPVAAWFAASATGFTLRRQLAILGPPLAASLIMAAGVYALSGIAAGHAPLAAVIAVLVAAGVLLYGAALWLLDPSVRAAVAKRLLRPLSRQAATP